MSTPTKKFESENVKPQQSASIHMDHNSIIERPDLKEDLVITESLDRSHAEELIFMEEMVEVLVHESTDKNAEPMVEVYNNGTVQRFARGRSQICKRKYLEVLARAKETSIATNEDTNRNGEKYYRVDKYTALKYPFSVIRDDNPKGQAWLKSVLASA